MALIQATVDDEIKRRADEVIARNGLTTAMAVRVMVTQVARDGVSPFDGLFTRPAGEEFSDAMRRDMVIAEAQEYGLIPDDSLDDPTAVPDDVLADLGISPEEVGQ